jgi:acetyl esterase/lipase
MGRLCKVLAWAGLAAAATMAMGAAPVSQAPSARPTVAADGTVHVPAFDLPPSSLASKQAVNLQILRARLGGAGPQPSDDVATMRQKVEKLNAPIIQMMRSRYPVDVVEQKVGGVPSRIVTPKDKPFDQQRVLINLHGGAFSMCADSCGLMESMPISSLGGYKVVTVNYRMAPEARHPAAVEDVAAVYRELLKTYKPEHIGIYGCSAGGALTAQAAAWLPAHGLPQAGAVGIFGSGAIPFGAGDSAYLAGYVEGSFPPPPAPGQPKTDLTQGYFAKTDPSDPFAWPGKHPDELAKFPPTLIITATRAPDMSPAIYTNSQLLKAGVSSTLVVGEGLNHCYVYMPMLPEAQDAYQLIIGFFRKNLG